MFYDFNRHKRAAAKSAAKEPEIRPLHAGIQKRLAHIPEKSKMAALILLISLSGLGFSRLIVDGITGNEFSGYSAGQPKPFYRKNPPPIETYLDSLLWGHIQDSLSDSSLKP
jgi:hypothetical protein